MQDDLDPSPTSKVNGHGGARPGAGRKPAGYVKPEPKADYDEAKARSETAKAGLLELELRTKTGELVERSAVQQAVATAFATVAQALRMIPDNLERHHGLSGDQAEAVADSIDTALSDLSKTLALLGGEPITED